MADLHQALIEYAALYAETYGRDEPVVELIPAMLGAFLEGDRAFARARSGANAFGRFSDAPISVPPSASY